MTVLAAEPHNSQLICAYWYQELVPGASKRTMLSAQHANHE